MAYNSIKCELLTAEGHSWEQMAQELLAAAALRQGVVRLVFFASCNENAEYAERRTFLERLAATYFESPRPVLSLIAQKPLVGELILEVHSLNAANADVLVREVTTPFGHYLRIESPDYREIVAGGLGADCLDAPMLLQSQQAFSKMQQILSAEQMDWEDIVRQWNYLEWITAWDDDSQRYQDFNEVRSHAYSSSGWSHGYPAATGIGAQAGGVQIDFNAVKGDVRIIPLDNDWQRAAHVYSGEVLISHRTEKGTPKFERGKQLSGAGRGVIYVSGTAAIRGEESIGAEVLSQTKITIENIQHLIAADSPVGEASPCIHLLRAYLKNEKDITPVRKEMETLCPGIPVAYLYADVCREELLIEIEGIATN